MNFEEIYEAYGPKVFRLCMGYVNDYDRAKDLVQETFISVWQNLDKFRHESSISTWIYRIATNICLRQVERQKRTISVDLPEQLAEKNEPQREEQIEMLFTFISMLEEADRIIISLVLEDVPQSEIASIVGMRKGTLRVRIHRIKQKLANCFSGHE